MTKTVEYYRSKGFDQKAAEYFASGRRQIVAVVANNDFTLTISFDNGEKRLYDVRPLLKKGAHISKRAQNPKEFCASFVSSAGGSAP